jgi:hypothetical protein
MYLVDSWRRNGFRVDFARWQTGELLNSLRMDGKNMFNHECLRPEKFYVSCKIISHKEALSQGQAEEGTSKLLNDEIIRRPI